MKNFNRKNIAKLTAIGLITTGMVTGAPALAGSEKNYSSDDKQTSNNIMSSVEEAWRQGKVESVFMLNEHLSAFDIDTQVKGSEIWLSGTVKNEVQKDLAQQLALSIDGIDKVQNKLAINENMKSYDKTEHSKERNFSQAIGDATLTATVKTRLIGSEAKARNIDVDTHNSVVTLSGTVESDALSDLAESIAQNTEGVVEVENNLKVNDKVAAR